MHTTARTAPTASTGSPVGVPRGSLSTAPSAGIALSGSGGEEMRVACSAAAPCSAIRCGIRCGKDYVDASESGPLAEGSSAKWQADARLMLCGGALQRAVRATVPASACHPGSTETVHGMLGGAVCGSLSAGDPARHAWYAAPTWQAAFMPDKAPP